MRGRNRKAAWATVLLALISGLILSAVPGEAQNRDLGACIADATGRFPSATLRCDLRIPNGTLAGEYNLVGRCPSATSGPDAYPVATGSSSGPLGVSSNRVNPGQTITASGDGCRANSVVSFTLERIGTLIGLGGSLFSGTAYAQDGTRTLTARITVVEPGRVAASAPGTGNTAPVARGGLARTGLSVLPWLAVGLSALALGTGLVVAGRRRAKGSPAGGS